MKPSSWIVLSSLAALLAAGCGDLFAERTDRVAVGPVAPDDDGALPALPETVDITGNEPQNDGGDWILDDGAWVPAGEGGCHPGDTDLDTPVFAACVDVVRNPHTVELVEEGGRMLAYVYDKSGRLVQVVRGRVGKLDTDEFKRVMNAMRKFVGNVPGGTWRITSIVRVLARVRIDPTTMLYLAALIGPLAFQAIFPNAVAAIAADVPYQEPCARVAEYVAAHNPDVPLAPLDPFTCRACMARELDQWNPYRRHFESCRATNTVGYDRAVDDRLTAQMMRCAAMPGGRRTVPPPQGIVPCEGGVCQTAGFCL